MGLLDQILAQITGGQASPGTQTRSSATSPLVKALMLLLAAKAYQHYTSRPQGSAAPSGGGFGQTLDPRTTSPGMGAGMGSGSAGGLGGVLSGGLGGLLGGLVGGGGLSTIVDQFRQTGHGNAIDSWVGRGQNQYLAPNQLADALGPDTVEELAQQTGMPRDEVLSELSRQLPEAVDQFTPEGRLPTEQDVSRWV